MAGLNHTTEKVVTLDDDGQTLLKKLKPYQYAIKKKFDVVYSSYPKKRHHLLRNLCSWINGKVANLMLRKPAGLYLSSFRSMSRFILKEITKYDLPYPYVDGLILRSTSNIGTLETAHKPRTSGKSGYTIRKLFRLWLNMFTKFSALPLNCIHAGCFRRYFNRRIHILRKVINLDFVVGLPLRCFAVF